MTKTKRRHIILGITASLLVLCIFFIAAVLVKVNYIPIKIENIYDRVYESPSISIQADNEEFKILKISDTHLINGKTKNDLKTLEKIEVSLSNNKFDLVILNGDIVDGFNLNFSFNKYSAIDSLATILEKYSVSWTFVPGNNDGEMQGDNKKMIAYLMQYEHFIVGNTREVDGDVNFVIDIESNGVVVHSLILLDSHSRKFPVIGTYDHIKQSQIDYVKKISESRSAFVSIFFHMPTARFEKAYNDGILIADYNQNVSKPLGHIKNSELFDNGIADCSNITLISCSHIHSNKMLAFYDNRYYELNSASGYGADRNKNIKTVVTEIAINLLSTSVEEAYSFNQY